MSVPMTMTLTLLPHIGGVSDKPNQPGSSRVWQRSVESYRLLNPLLARTGPSQVFGNFGIFLVNDH